MLDDDEGRYSRDRARCGERVGDPESDSEPELSSESAPGAETPRKFCKGGSGLNSATSDSQEVWGSEVDATGTRQAGPVLRCSIWLWL